MGRRWMQIATIGVCAIVGLSTLTVSNPASAEPPTTLASARAQLDELETQQRDIATQQAASQEKLQAAQNQLVATQAQISTQQAQNSQLQSQLAQIALQQYQNRGLDTTALLMTSNSVDTMLNQIVVMQQVTDTANSLITALQLNQGTLSELQRSQEASLVTIEQEQAKLKELNQQLQSQVSQASSLLNRMTAAAAAAQASSSTSNTGGGSPTGDGGGGGNGVTDPSKMVPNPSPSLICPMRSYVMTSPFGMRLDPVIHVYQLHDGVDMAAPSGTIVYAPANGYVVDYYWAGGYGNRMVLDNGIIGGRHIVTTYSHLSGKIATPGTLVAQGDPIVTVGSTGWSTGPHLHYQVWIDGQLVDPAPYI